MFAGGWSQIYAELILIENAVNNRKYEYLHLLSGMDLPIKSQKEIHDFFNCNRGYEFVQLIDEPIENDKIGPFGFYQRMSLYHFGLKFWRKSKILKYIEYISIYIQYKFGIDRIRNDQTQYYHGANWFSITGEFAKYIIQNEGWIREKFSFYTRCCDEVFLQTLIMKSPFKNKMYKNVNYPENNNDTTIDVMRKVDWTRGHPYVFQLCDHDELIGSNMLYARKFDERIDKDIIVSVCNEIGAR